MCLSFLFAKCLWWTLPSLGAFSSFFLFFCRTVVFLSVLHMIANDETQVEALKTVIEWEAKDRKERKRKEKRQNRSEWDEKEKDVRKGLVTEETTTRMQDGFCLGSPQGERGSTAPQLLNISLKTRGALTGLAESIHLPTLEFYGAFCYTDKKALEFNSPWDRVGIYW